MTNHPIEPHPALAAAAKAIHEHLCRRNIMQYLANDEDCEGIARAVLLSLLELLEDVIAAGERAAWDDHNHMPAIRAMPRAVTAMINTIIGESA